MRNVQIIKANCKEMLHLKSRLRFLEIISKINQFLNLLTFQEQVFYAKWDSVFVQNVPVCVKQDPMSHKAHRSPRFFILICFPACF